jgi:hypothetical protein
MDHHLGYIQRRLGFPVHKRFFLIFALLGIFTTDPHHGNKHARQPKLTNLEACAAHIISIAKEDGLTNIANLLTKLLPGPCLVRKIVSYLLWY